MRNGRQEIKLRGGNFRIGDGVLFGPSWSQNSESFNNGGNIDFVEPEFCQTRAFGNEARRTWVFTIMAEPVLKRAGKHSGRKQCEAERKDATSQLGGEFHLVLLGIAPFRLVVKLRRQISPRSLPDQNR